MGMGFASILILLAIIVGIFTVVSGNKKNQLPKGKSQKKLFFSNTKIAWLLIGYIAILLLSAGVYALIPSSSAVNKTEQQEITRESKNLHEAVESGRIDHLDPALINQKWEKDYHDKLLNLKIDSDTFLDTSIIIKRKAINDGKIEGAFYSTKALATVNGIDIGKEIKPGNWEWSGNTLFFKQPQPIKVNFTLDQKPFTIMQFTGGHSFGGNTSIRFGTQLLYMQIPKDLKIVNHSHNNLNIVYVGQ